ncbi:MAG: D-tyrosyl-tRNA(Tyr) deacylase [Chloroflexi bacterium]|nr:D-tyrosyl-tRNA(Tyr) deacylase [Chloroflexota bacterium]MBS60907.1 D-tyrosyl-tRNA(Tyr) deacylase [Anaerolineaceae bacterium]HCU81224.1 D-tyrosyl-tRNA(Tyr) deacylase [Chloroflexota bacterium]|tara:strand:- start:465 stop:926 length:462 start_codon:yes stop_codon:yes gene_type:complete
MRLLIQRVSKASVSVTDTIVGKIDKGLLVLVGVGQKDSKSEAEWLARKTAQLRIFADANGKTNLCLSEVYGSALVVSQFTLYADTRKGRRPSFINAATSDVAEPLIEYFAKQLETYGIPVKLGKFGADMQVALVNDGPVTIWMEHNSNSKSVK